MKVLLRLLGAAVGHGDQANAGEVCRPDLQVGVVRRRATDICMFDWPEQIQTSPASTSLKVRVFLPLTVSVYGPPVGSGSSVTCHLPSAPAVAVLHWSLMVTVTSSPGLGPAPDAVFLIALKHHVIAEDGRQLHIGPHGGPRTSQRSRREPGPKPAHMHAIACNPKHERIDRLPETVKSTPGSIGRRTTGDRGEPGTTCPV